MNLSAGASLMAAVAIGGLGIAPAHADINNPAINGTFLATSNGEWAKTNDSYHDEATVRSVWTISTSCVNPIECTGTVVSDQGWTANITHMVGMWKVTREIPNWETCGVGPGAYPHPADGTAATGRQLFVFYPVGTDPSLLVDANSTTFSGTDTTTGPTGACGWNQPLDISMPFKLVKIG